MREVTCAACQAKMPMNEAFSLAERHMCRSCLEQFLSSQESQSEAVEGIAQLVDPTICVHCAADAGNEEWSTIASLPACSKCCDFFRNRPYPGWLKVSMAVFLCVALAAFIYNLRFFMAYIDILAARRAMESGNVENAVGHWQSAATRVPDMPELAVIPNFFKAQELVGEDKYQEALALIHQSRAHAPGDMSTAFRQVELGALIGQAFDSKDYDAFLALSQESADLTPDSAYAVASLASAYACKYAVTGDQQFREKALDHLQKARSLVSQDGADFQAYENRIRHRLKTREIIDKDEFEQRFPNGWNVEDGQ